MSERDILPLSIGPWIGHDAALIAALGLSGMGSNVIVIENDADRMDERRDLMRRLDRMSDRLDMLSMFALSPDPVRDPPLMPRQGPVFHVVSAKPLSKRAKRRARGRPA